MDRLPDFRDLARNRLLALMALLVICAYPQKGRPDKHGKLTPSCPNCAPRISGIAAGPVCPLYAAFPARNADGTVMGVMKDRFIAGKTPGRFGEWVDEYAMWLADRWSAGRLGVAVPACPLQDDPPGLLAYLRAARGAVAAPAAPPPPRPPPAAAEAGAKLIYYI